MEPPRVRWRVRFGSAIEAERDGAPHRFRTRQQLWLLARLAVGAGGREGPLDRADAADGLWPEAEPAHARAYLRRALMELRAAGVPFGPEEKGLALDPEWGETDFADAAASGALGLQGEAILPGVESPLLDEIRRRARHLAKGAPPPSAPPEATGERRMLALLGESLLAHAPEEAMALVAGHRYDFYTKAPEDDVLRFLERLCEACPAPSADKVAVLCIMGGLNMIRTRYRAADERYREAIRDAEGLGERGLLARALAMRFGTLMELRDWPGAQAAAYRAVEIAREAAEATEIAFALAARAGYESHTGQYDAAAKSYDEAIGWAEPGPHREVARHNLAYVWGVLGGRLDAPPAMRPPEAYEGSHLKGAQSYERFALGVGHGRPRDAALGAAGALASAAEGGMERLVAINLDNAAIAFSFLDRPVEAAACVRLGGRLRRDLEHPRSRMERDALRRHGRGGYFGPEVRACLERWRARDPEEIARRVAAALRRAGAE